MSENNHKYISEIAEDICKKRYYQKDESGKCVETWPDLVSRIVNHVCKNEDEKIKSEIYNLILNTYFLPNSPCLVNAGAKSKSQGCLACFVTKSPEDCWSSENVGMAENIAIFGHIARRGGGVGVSLSKIRPEGSTVFGSAHAKACGPIEHMRMLSEVMASITQSGFRGMAMMATLKADHPDIFKFIVCKQRERALKTLLKEDPFGHYNQIVNNIDSQLQIILDKFIHNFNISVVVTDEFMKRVENDEEWELKFNDVVYDTVKARDIFNSIAENAWKNGDPGLLFYDAMNNSPYKYSGQEIDATNPCFSGDTLVAVADGRNFVSIKQLAEEGKDVPVYCCDPKTNNIHIRWGRNPRKTRNNAQLCKVKFDDGGSIITTPDHKILKRNGDYEKVNNLCVGDSVMTMTKFEYVSHRSRYYGIVKGDGDSTKPEHKMIYEFNNSCEIDSEQFVIHHKDFNGSNNQISNLEKMSYNDHSSYHRQFNNPMTTWYKNATLEEKQKHHERMSAVTSGKNNGMYGKTHSNETKFKIGKKTKDRSSDPEYIEKLSKSISDFWKNNEMERQKCSKRIKNNWESGKYDSMKSPMVTKKCECCGKEFIEKEYIAKSKRFCSSKCVGKCFSLIPEEVAINNVIQFISEKGFYPTASIWDNYKNSICSREVIRRKCGGFINVCEKLVDNGIFADIVKNSKMSVKLISAAIVNWTIKNGRNPSLYDINKDICNKDTIKKYGGFDYIMKHASYLINKHYVNHKVISVEMLDKTSDVYNITVDDFHNLCILSSHIKKEYGKKRDVVSRYSTIVYKNCGEQPMPGNFSCCNLGSIDVSKYYDEKTNELKWKELSKAIHLSMRFLDNVIDVNVFPTEEFEKWAKDNRPVGLGIMGWADLLLKMKIAYGKKKSLEFAEKVVKFFKDEAHKASVVLAKERGTPKNCKYDELEHRRSITTLTCAPTGSISQIAGCSSGIEPHFSTTIVRVDNTGKRVTTHEDADKSYFRCALDPDKKEGREISYEEHILMQAAFQKHIDSSISKTINMSKDATIDDVKNAYKLAWNTKCKGITIYRDQSKSAQILSTSDDKKTIFRVNNAPARPKKIAADIFKTRAIGKDWHIIIGKVENKPYEVFAVNGSVDLPEKGFVVKQKSRHYSLFDDQDNILIDNLSSQERDINVNVDKETRRFSLELRHGVHPKFIVEQIDKSNEYVGSLCNALKRIFSTKYITMDELMEKADYCPECANKGKKNKLIPSDGCWKCIDIDCFYSKCG